VPRSPVPTKNDLSKRGFVVGVLCPGQRLARSKVYPLTFPPSRMPGEGPGETLGGRAADYFSLAKLGRRLGDARRGRTVPGGLRLWRNLFHPERSYVRTGTPMEAGRVRPAKTTEPTREQRAVHSDGCRSTWRPSRRDGAAMPRPFAVDAFFMRRERELWALTAIAGLRRR